VTPALRDAGPIGRDGRHRDAAVPGITLVDAPGRPLALPIGQARCGAGGVAPETEHHAMPHGTDMGVSMMDRDRIALAAVQR
jgi:hypothetical protein